MALPIPAPAVVFTVSIARRALIAEEWRAIPTFALVVGQTAMAARRTRPVILVPSVASTYVSAAENSALMSAVQRPPTAGWITPAFSSVAAAAQTA